MSRRARTLLVLPVLAAFLAGGPATAQIADPDVVGIYWDDAYTVTDAVDADVPHMATGYLVLHNPTETAGGLGGWECRVEVTGNPPLNWSLAGDAVNYDTPPDFVVGFTQPRPVTGADVLLATFQMYVADASPMQVSLVPRQWAPSLPDAMSYIPWDDKELLTPMTTVTGTDLVASYNWGPWCETDRTTISFGSDPVGLTESARVMVTNSGGGSLTVDPVITGDGADAYALRYAGSYPFDLMAGQSAYVWVDFSPTAVQLYQASLDLGTGCDPIPLSGQGRDLVMSYYLDPPSIDLGTTVTGSGRTGSATIVNNGEASFQVAPSTGCPGFSVDPIVPFTLDPGEARTINVTFVTGTPGTYVCDVSLGEGLNPLPVQVTVEDAATAVEVFPSSLDFGTTYPGGSVFRTFQVTNHTNAAITTTLALADPSLPFRIVAPGSPVTLYSGDAQTVSLRYEPGTEGEHATTLEMPEAGVSVPLHGVSSYAVGEVSLQPSELDFGDVYLGTGTQRSVLVVNGTDQTLAIDPTIAQSGTVVFSMVGTPMYDYLEPGQYVRLWVRAMPSQVGEHLGTMYAGPGVPGVPLRVYGRVNTSGVTVSPTALDFGRWPVGADAELEVEVFNNNWAAVDMDVFLDPPGGPFTISAGASIGVVAPKSRGLIRVRFQPTQAGEFATVLRLSPSLDPVPVAGEAAASVPVCDVAAGELAFPPTATGQGTSRVLTVTNTGTAPLSLDPVAGCGAFSVPAGPETVAPGTSVDVVVVFRPETVGEFACTLDLGGGACGDVTLTGTSFTGSPGGGSDRVGLYFDAGYTQPWIFEVGDGEPFEAYLVLRDPSVVDEITGWELKVLTPESVVLQGANLATGSYNFSTPPDFTVGLSTPMPPGATMLLGTLSFLPVGVPDNLPLALVPKRNPSLPDAMAYSHGPSHALQPMYPVDGDPFVAWVNYWDPTVGTDERPDDDEVPAAAPEATRLLPNVPNPFNPETTVRFELARAGRVRIDVYDVMGRRVARLLDEARGTGPGRVTWRGRDDRGRTLPSGSYYVRLVGPDRTDTHKVMLLK